MSNNLSLSKWPCKPGYAWLIWVVGSLFYAIEFFQRVAPSVMAAPISSTFQINASAMSSVMSLYLYAYAITQIPVGMLLDRYGMRRLLTLACFVVSLGTFAFATVDTLWSLAIARILVGIGSAFAFIGILKLASNWYSIGRFPLIVGLTNTVGILGALLGQAPFAHLIAKLGWQVGLMWTAIAGMLVSALLLIIVRDYPCIKGISGETTTSALLRKSLRSVLSNGQTWLTAFYAAIMVIPVIAFGELFSVWFLMRAYSLSHTMAATVSMGIFIGIGVGGPVNGWLYSLTGRSKVTLWIGHIFALICLTIVIYGKHTPNLTLFFLLFGFGFFTSSMLATFTMNRQRHLPQYSGSVIAFTNTTIMVSGGIFQVLIGHLLDFFTHHTGIAQYSARDFHHALAILPIVLILNLILLKLIKI